MFKRILVICVLWMAWSAAAHAQVGVCPAGTIPNGTQTSAMECAPDPDYQAQQQPAPPPPVWADRWGAIAAAVDSSPPAFGAAADMPTQESAEAAAMAQCEATAGATCAIGATYRNQCFAETWGNVVAMSDTAAAIDEAERLSLDLCKAKGNSKCIPYYSACSYPVRIQ